MFRVLVICLASTTAYAVSNPDLSSKSTKLQSSSSINQQTQQKAISQNDEALLNSINAYAQQYDSSSPPKQFGITTQLYPHPYVTQPYPSSQGNYKLQSQPQLPSTPTIETNFQPITPSHQQQQHQHHLHQSQPQIQPQQIPSAPIIMQYVPQSQGSDGVQYLQLIPTRPLILPISPYMSPVPQPYQAPQIITPQLNEYPPRQVLSAVPDSSANIPYGLQAYANNLQNYRGYRFNREIKANNIPAGITLNMNEYMPSPDAPKHLLMIKGRP